MGFHRTPPKSSKPRPRNPPELKVDYSIDYDHWLKRDVWNIGEAASILENTDPIKLRSRLEVDFEFRQRFDKTLNIIIWAEGRTLEVEEKSIWKSNENSLKYGLVKPAIFIQWAVSRYDIPTPLHILIDNLQDLPTASNQGTFTPAFTHPPSLRNDWFKVIETVMYKYKNKFRHFPDHSQVWATMWANPPTEYTITRGENRIRRYSKYGRD